MKYINTKILLLQLIVITSLYAMDAQESNDPHFAYARHVIEKHLNLTEFDSIIDFGCRNGSTTHYMHEHARKNTLKIIGLDPSLAAIAQAQKRQLIVQFKDEAFNSSPKQSLTRKESFSSSPSPGSTSYLSSEIDLGVPEYQEDATPVQDVSFYQRTITPENRSFSNPINLATSIVHIPTDRIKFFVDNLVSLSYPSLTRDTDKRAQLVTSFNNIHSFHDKNIFFTNMITLLRDNGTLLITTQLQSTHSQLIYDIFIKKVSETPWKEHFQNFFIEEACTFFTSLHEIQELLKKHMFRNSDIICQKRYCDTRETMSIYLQQEFEIFRQFRGLSVEQKKQLCDAIAHEYTLSIPRVNDSIPLPESVIVKARRHIFAPFSGLGWKH